MMPYYLLDPSHGGENADHETFTTALHSERHNGLSYSGLYAPSVAAHPATR